MIKNLTKIYFWNMFIVSMAVKTKKGKTNKIKPIRATVVEDPSDWKKMWQTALTPPTETQIDHMRHLRRCFGS